MAVPKKRTSKSKKNSRKTNLNKQAFEQTQKAFSLAIAAVSKGVTSTK